jgi:hypothetical protein
LLRKRSQPDPAAKGTSGFLPLPRWASKEVNAAFLVLDLVGKNASCKRERDARRLVHPKLDDPEEALGFIVEEQS